MSAINHDAPTDEELAAIAAASPTPHRTLYEAGRQSVIGEVVGMLGSMIRALTGPELSETERFELAKNASRNMSPEQLTALIKRMG